MPKSELDLLRNNSTRLLPVISWEDIENYLEDRTKVLTKYSEHGDWAATELALSDRAFVLISKASMEPRLSRGTLIFVEPINVALDGDLVLVSYLNEGQVALRMVSIDGNERSLQSLKTGALPESFDDNKKIIGLVVQTKFTYRQELEIA